jgi:hypothetical protein
MEFLDGQPQLTPREMGAQAAVNASSERQVSGLFCKVYPLRVARPRDLSVRGRKYKQDPRARRDDDHDGGSTAGRFIQSSCAPSVTMGHD